VRTIAPILPLPRKWGEGRGEGSALLVACIFLAACSTPASTPDAIAAFIPDAAAEATDIAAPPPDILVEAPAINPADAAAEARSFDAAPDADVTPPDATDARVDAPADTPAPDVAEAGLPARVLLYHFSTLDIPSVPAQLAFFKAKLEGWGYAVEDSVDAARFTDGNLTRYAAVAMINTCFEPFGVGKNGAAEGTALQKFVARGGGLFGTHCADVTFQGVNPVPVYNQLFGGRGGNGFFDGKSACRKLGDHPTVAALPATFDFTGNLDNTEYLAPSSMIELRCKWGAGDMRDVAVSWWRTEGAGRVFYTNLGKVDADLTDPTLGDKHIVPGLAWVLGR
jgi:type 1 glutamine amidotransferase